MERIEHLAVHVELELSGGRVADAHRLRALVAGQPVENDLEQPPFATDAVHDLERRRITRGRPKQPDPPGASLLEIARVEEGQQRQRRITEPAVAVVPVPLAADLLRQ